jgi:hypothetical protein
MNKAVFGIVQDLNQAEKIVTDLKRAGFATDSISLLYGHSELEGAITEEDVTDVTTGDFTTRRDVTTPRTKKIRGGVGHEKHTKASEGAALGGTAGGVLGGTLGLLAGIGSLAIPGMGPFIAAGPIMAALAGSGIGGSIGLLTGGLVGLGIPEYEAVHYAERLKEQGTVLLSVHTRSSDEVDKVKDIFERDGVEDIATARETAGAGGRTNRKNQF